MPQPITDAAPHALVAGRGRSRMAVAVLFVLAGTVMGSWAGRIPSVREPLGVSDGEWGLIVLAAPVGVLLSLLVLSRIITRTGSRTPSIVGAAGMLVLVPVCALATTPLMLVGCLLALGVAQGLLFGPMNALAVEVERGYGRSILSSFHFWFSGGQFLGGLFGVLAGMFALAPAIQLAASSLLLAALFLATRRFLPDTQRTSDGLGPPDAQLVPDAQPTPDAGTSALHLPPEAGEESAGASAVGVRLELAGGAGRAGTDRGTGASDSGPARARSWTPQLVLLAVIAFLTSVNEGGSIQWSAQYSVSLGGGIAVGSLTLVCYSIAIAGVRLVGDRIVEALGRRRFQLLSASVSAVGLGVGLAIGTIPAAMVGFACVGLGSGCIVPTVMTLAGNQRSVPSAKAVALISLGEWPAFLLGPPVIGGIAEFAGLGAGLWVIVAGAVLIVVLAGFLKDPTRTHADR